MWCLATSDFARRHGHNIKTCRIDSSRHPSEFAGFDLLDFVYALRRGVEPNADVAVTLPELYRHVFYRHPGIPCRLQGLDDPFLQGSARSSRFCFGRREPGHALFSPSVRPPGFHCRRDSGSGCRAHPGLLPAGNTVLYGCCLGASESVQLSL